MKEFTYTEFLYYFLPECAKDLHKCFSTNDVKESLAPREHQSVIQPKY